MEEAVKTLADIGEFGFIEFLRSKFNVNLDPSVVLGIGDDVAVIDVGGSEYLLATCDSQIGDVHFPVGLIPPYDLGCRIVEVNASDVAAMGGTPRWALLGLNLPSQTSITFLEEFYTGVGDSLARMGAWLVGGNCARTKQELVIDLFLMGTVPKNQLVRRKGTSAGDVVLVTGTLGKSRAGLEVVLGNVGTAFTENVSVVERAKQSFFHPRARITEGRKLAQSGFVTAMIDISDGLLQDLGHLASENQLDVVVDIARIPVDPLCEEIAKQVGADPLVWALIGGEDYELLFSVPGDRVPELMAWLGHEATMSSSRTISPCSESDVLTAPITPIGFFREGSGKVFLKGLNGEIIPSEAFIGASGWDHFRGGNS
jgi:thiamine-monophosphate kinase